MPHLCKGGVFFFQQNTYKSRTYTWLSGCGFFVMLIAEKGGDFLTIEEYIKSKDIFRLMPFVTVYTTICELLNDGYIEQSAFEKGGGADVAVHKFEPERKSCGRLYSAGDFHSNR